MSKHISDYLHKDISYVHLHCRTCSSMLLQWSETVLSASNHTGHNMHIKQRRESLANFSKKTRDSIRPGWQLI